MRLFLADLRRAGWSPRAYREIIEDKDMGRGSPTRGGRDDHTEMKHLSEFKLDMISAISLEARRNACSRVTSEVRTSESSDFVRRGQSILIRSFR